MKMKNMKDDYQEAQAGNGTILLVNFIPVNTRFTHDHAHKEISS